VASWIERFIDLSDASQSSVQLALMQMARKTNDRYRDISDKLREDVVRELQNAGAREHLIELVQKGGHLESDEAAEVFGESLPAGLRLR